MVDLIDTVQELNIDDSFIELFDIELVWYDSSQFPPKQEVTIHLINGLEDGSLNLWMPYDNGTALVWAEYLAVPIEIEGIAISSDGPQGRPTLSVANVASLARSISSYPSDGDGTDDEVAFSGGSTSIYDSILENLNITKNEDIIGSIVTYRKTLRKNTYVYNSINDKYYTYSDREDEASPIDSSTVPNPKEFPEGRFVLDRVAAETSLLVQFELASPFDIQGLKVPNRYVIGKYCPWEYKGAINLDGSFKNTARSGCNWNPDGSADRPYVDIENAVTVIQTEDVCGKTLQACKARFHANGNDNTPLPFGGFPGSRKFR
jgi:lambda family phage minor tail protein L